VRVKREGAERSKAVTIDYRSYRYHCNSVELSIFVVIIRPHHRTTYMYVNVAYCYRPSSVVCRLVCQSICHSSEPCKNGCTDQDGVWVEDSGGPKEPCITRGPDPPWEWAILRGKGASIVKYRDTLRSSVQKRLN